MTAFPLLGIFLSPWIGACVYCVLLDTVRHLRLRSNAWCRIDIFSGK